MTKPGRPAAAGRGRTRKLKLKKETIKDLDAKRGARRAKGGVKMVDYAGVLNVTGMGTCDAASCQGYTCFCTETCLYTCYCH
jgi:hypothetical protein